MRLLQSVRIPADVQTAEYVYPDRIPEYVRFVGHWGREKVAFSATFPKRLSHLSYKYYSYIIPYSFISCWQYSSSMLILPISSFRPSLLSCSSKAILVFSFLSRSSARSARFLSSSARFLSLSAFLFSLTAFFFSS